MKKSVSKVAAGAALVFAAQVALSACGDDDGGVLPSGDAGATDTTEDVVTDPTSQESSSGATGTDAATADETSSTGPGTGDGGSGDDTSEMSSTSGEGGTGGSLDAGGDAEATGDMDADVQSDAGSDSGPVACYGDEIPSTADCSVYPYDCEGPPHALEACGHYAFVLKAEAFQALFDCYDAQEVEDHCSEEALEAISACYEEVHPQVCVSPVDQCATLAEECTDMTATDCNEIVAPYSMMWLEVAAWPISEVSCMSREGIGEGAGCGERLERCLAGLDEED